MGVSNGLAPGSVAKATEVLKSQMEYLKQYKEWRTMSGDFGFGRNPGYVDNVLAELKKIGY